MNDLLKIKRENQGADVKLLQDVINDWISVIQAEDVLLVEEIVGVKARQRH